MGHDMVQTPVLDKSKLFCVRKNWQKSLNSRKKINTQLWKQNNLGEWTTVFTFALQLHTRTVTINWILSILNQYKMEQKNLTVRENN